MCSHGVFYVSFVAQVNMPNVVPTSTWLLPVESWMEEHVVTSRMTKFELVQRFGEADAEIMIVTMGGPQSLLSTYSDVNGIRWYELQQKSWKAIVEDKRIDFGRRDRSMMILRE